MGKGPVVRQLGSRDLFIGDRRAANPDTYEGEPPAFEHVLTVSHAEEPLTTHHHPLDDGPGNAPSAFDAAVDTARALHRQDSPLLVHCAAGVSRSATVLATTLAVEDRSRFADGLGIVQRHRERACPHPALREQGRRYLRAADEHDPTATDPGRTARTRVDDTLDRSDDDVSGVTSGLRSLLEIIRRR